jgi:hypothetical protein
MPTSPPTAIAAVTRGGASTSSSSATAVLDSCTRDVRKNPSATVTTIYPVFTIEAASPATAAALLIYGFCRSTRATGFPTVCRTSVD